MERVTDRIYHDLREHGIETPCYGEKFLCDALEIMEADPASLTFISKGIYPPIAKRYNTSISSVERNLRFLIEKLWEREAENGYFKMMTGKALTIRPRNGEFLSIMYAYYVGNMLETKQKE